MHTKIIALPIVLLMSWSASAAPLCSQIFTSGISIHTRSSQALMDPVVDRARELNLWDDFKTLADLSLRTLSSSQKEAIAKQTQILRQQQGEKVATKYWIESMYEHRRELLPVQDPTLKSQWTVKSPDHRATFEHIETMWAELTRQTPKDTTSSLIPLPHPLLIPGARFQEGYYWDSYFAFPALLKTGRQDIVKGQVDNFLFLLKNYGLIPNGTRDYYLTRSQPPLISQMVRLVLEHEMAKGELSPSTRQWLAEAYPLIKKDYEQFWMNPQTRYDKRTGLNHFWDSSNTPRPERHSSDKETEIAHTFRDVKAEAESGKDFTEAFEGRASEYGAVSLNSILFQVERDLAWMGRLLNKDSIEVQGFETASVARQKAMDKYMWDQSSQVYRDVHLPTLRKSQVVTADTFMPLHYKIASDAQAKGVMSQLVRLERKGGIMSAEKDTGKQWDAPYGWAPHHFFAISGALKYGYQKEGVRLAGKWVQSVETIYQETGKVIEKIDAVRGGVPHEAGDKYPTQDGFLWTNGVYVWALTNVLKVPIIHTAH
ncbi:alpha,alpha-trehalase [Bdellovibrio sp. SKB1291214]|uniref:trehalase family glycosidase n=1 Tax=Bdellovibrio sp. SKB1291214 TaxID=1732569 RepID=UPI001C3E502F|nr:trehalase family glycosidase [Bdellovibrio sp. SKB1291214]UYL08636.1 alpha,alpha-trehalase [Bdellovibrio sp. SKB1291214]